MKIKLKIKQPGQRRGTDLYNSTSFLMRHNQKSRIDIPTAVSTETKKIGVSSYI